MIRKINRADTDLALLQEENAKYKSDRDKIKASYKTLNEDNNKLMTEYKLLKHENEKLKDQLRSEKQRPIMSVTHHKDELKKLKQNEN